MNLFHMLGAAAVVAGLTAADLQAATFNTLTGEAPVVIAHRGVPAEFPENGLAGYEASMAQGADLLETDVLSTLDGEIVLMHDTDLNRTTNVADIFPGRENDRVSSFTLAEIKMLILKSVDGTGVTTELVPTLDEFLDTVNSFNSANGTEVGVLVELKGPVDQTVSNTVVDQMVAKGFDTPEKGQVQAFSTANTAFMADREAATPAADLFVAQLGLGAVPLSPTDALIVSDVTVDPATGALVPVDQAFLSDLVGYTDAIAMFMGPVPAPFLDPSSEALVDLAHSLGLKVYAWTFRFDTFAEARSMMAPFIASGVDGFITDQTALAVAVLAAVPLPGGLGLLLVGVVALGVAGARRAV